MSERKSLSNIKGMNYKKSNLIIGAKYKSTIYENKLLAAALHNIQNTKFKENDDIVATMTAAQLKAIFGKGNSIYSHLRPVAKSLIGRMIGIENDEKKAFHYMTIVTDADYEDGVCTITFNKKLRESLVQIQNKFTILSLPVMMEMKSVHSFRLFELLKSETFIGNRNCQQTMDGGFEFSISLSELKLEIGVVDASEAKVRAILDGKEKPDYDKAIEVAKEKKYNNWKDFKKAVLDVAVNEISEKTDMNISYEPIRAGKGGKTVGVTFYITYKDAKIEQTEVIEDIVQLLTEDEKLEILFEIKTLLGKNFSMADAKIITEKSGYSVKKVSEAIDVMALCSSEIKNPVAWLIKAMEENYQMPKAKKTRFTEFPQNLTKVSEMEELLLDN